MATECLQNGKISTEYSVGVAMTATLIHWKIRVQACVRRY